MLHPSDLGAFPWKNYIQEQENSKYYVIARKQYCILKFILFIHYYLPFPECLFWILSRTWCPNIQHVSHVLVFSTRILKEINGKLILASKTKTQYDLKCRCWNKTVLSYYLEFFKKYSISVSGENISPERALFNQIKLFISNTKREKEKDHLTEKPLNLKHSEKNLVIQQGKSFPFSITVPKAEFAFSLN